SYTQAWMDLRRQRTRWRRCAILVVAVSAGGLQGCNAISGVGDVAFIPCALQLGTTEDTSLAGGQGGTPFDDPCPPGQVLVGVQAGVTQGGVAMAGLGAACGAVSVSSHGPSAVTLTPGGSLPTHGVGSDIQSVTCPAGQVVVGFDGKTFMD